MLIFSASNWRGFYMRAAFIAIASIMAIAYPAPAAPKDAPTPQENEGQDENPTKIVLWSVRNEYFNLPGNGWRNVLLLRGDKAILRDKPKFPGRQGLLLRIDVPFAFVRVGDASRAGLGNIYLQAMSIPHLTRKFAFAVGSGLALPTNTNDSLATNKWVAAPIAVPIWFTPQKGFFLIKSQAFLSFAGPGPDVRLLKIQPIYLLPLKRRWWLQFDTESTTGLNLSGHTGFTSGARLGKLMSRHLAMWIEPRVGWGRYRESDFGLRSSVYWIR